MLYSSSPHGLLIQILFCLREAIIILFLFFTELPQFPICYLETYYHNIEQVKYNMFVKLLKPLILESDRLFYS